MSFVIRYKRSHTTSRKNKYKNRHTKITQIIVDVCLSNEKMSKLFRKNQKSCHINVIWREKLVQPTKQDYGDLPENKKIRLCASYEILTAELGIRIPYLQVWIPGLIWHRFWRFYFSLYSLGLFRLRRYMKHLRQCFISHPNTSNFVPNTPLVVVFSTLLSVFGYHDEILSRVWSVTSHCLRLMQHVTTFPSWFMLSLRHVIKLFLPLFVL